MTLFDKYKLELEKLGWKQKVCKHDNLGSLYCIFYYPNLFQYNFNIKLILKKDRVGIFKIYHREAGTYSSIDPNLFLKPFIDDDVSLK